MYSEIKYHCLIDCHRVRLCVARAPNSPNLYWCVRLLMYCMLKRLFMMTNFKLKIACGGPRASRDSVLKVIRSFNIQCSRAIRVNAEFILLYCNTADDIESMFGLECIAELNKIDCQPQLPPYIHTKRSIVIKRIDPFIYEQESDVIKTEIENQNIGLIINSIFKFPNSKTLKVTFTRVDMVDAAINRGLYMFNLSISHFNIERDNYVHLLVCYRCYQWNDHVAANCKKDISYKVCSICSSEHHTYKECDNNVKKCINCRGDHSTLSFTCPRRKECAEKVSNQISPNPVSSLLAPSSNKASTSYRKSVANTPSYDANINDNILKSTMCVIICSLKKYEEPNEFNNDLASLLESNGLPALTIGNVTPPFIKLSDVSMDHINRNMRSTPAVIDPTHDDDNSEVHAYAQTPQHIYTPKATKTMKRPTLRAAASTEKQSDALISPVATMVSKFKKLESTSNNNCAKKKRYTRKAVDH